MSKRGATQQLSKEGNFFGDGSGDVSGDDKPRKATAAQLANRKLKPLKGRPRVAGSLLDSVINAPPPSRRRQGPVPRPANAVAPTPVTIAGVAPGAPQSSQPEVTPSAPQPSQPAVAPSALQPSQPEASPAPEQNEAAPKRRRRVASKAPRKTNPDPDAWMNMTELYDLLKEQYPDITNQYREQSNTSQSFPPPSQQQSGTNAFAGFSPAPPSGGFNFSAGPGSAPNPFASQNTGSSNSGGGTNFSSSFTFGSNNNNASTPFGNIAQPSPASNAFGTTQSSSTPSNNVFGASSSAPTNNVFGSNNTSSAPTLSLFGASSSAQPNAFAGNSGSTNNAFATSSPAPSGSAFGATSSAAPSNNIFASATSGAPTGSLFGASTSANSTNLFGTATSSSPSTNMFANSTTPAQTSDTSSQPSSNNIFATASSAPSNNVFGSTAASTGPSNMFGNTTSSTPSSSIFSGATTSSAPSNVFSSAATSTAPSNLFGNATTSSAPSNNMFSSSTTSPAPSNMFGNAPVSSAPSSSVFGGAATSSAPPTALFSNPTSTTPSAPTAAGNTTSGNSNNIFASSAQQSGSSSSSQTPNLFTQSTPNSAPQSGIFNFGGQAGANTASESSENAPATSGPSQSSTSNLFSQSVSGFQPSSGGTGLFNFSAQSPSRPTTETATAADSGAKKDSTDTGDIQSKPSNNLFAQPPSNAAPQLGSSLFGSTVPSPSQPSSSGTPQAGTNLFGFSGQNTTQSTDSKAQEESSSKPSSTASLFARAASGSNTAFTPNQSGQSDTPKQDKPAGPVSSTNPFSTIAPSSSSLTSSAAPAFEINGASSTQDKTDAKLDGTSKSAAPAAQHTSTISQGSTGSSSDATKSDTKKVEMFRSVRTLNAWFKLRISEVPDDGSCAELAKVYLSQFKEMTGSTSNDAQAQSKSSGKRKADDDSDTNGVNGAGSPKKSKVQPSQSDNSAIGASNTANIFNSIANKPAQSPLRNVESATSPDAEAGPSNNNIFSASSSGLFTFGASGGTSGSTTPAGSPAKPSAFSQSAIKAPVFGQAESLKANDSKRKSADISSDEEDEESQDETTQRDKRQKTSPPASSADTGSVLNSRQASPDARNPFGHLSQDEGNKEDEDDASDDEENGEQGSTTPKATPKPSSGLFGRITKDDTPAESDLKTPEESGLFGRITGTSTENSKSATANPFGFAASSYELPGGAKTGPVTKTWNGDAGSPIKFGSSQPAQTGNEKKDAPSTNSNPFAGIATSSSSAPATLFKFTPAPTPPPASDSSPFKFNPIAATPSGSGSMLGSGLGSRATTPGLSTGASENETSAAENDDEEETQTVDTEAIASRTALTEEDKKTYDVLFDTDVQPVTMVRVVNKTEEEMKANPGKGTTKFEGKGKGPLRVLKHKKSGAVSILIKSEPMGRVLINTRVLPKFQYKRAKAKFAQIPVTDDKGGIVQTFLKFEDDGECTKFVDACVKNQPAS